MDGEDSDMAIDDVQLLNCGSGEFFLLVFTVYTCVTLQIGFRVINTALLTIILKCLTTIKSLKILQLILLLVLVHSR